MHGMDNAQDSKDAANIRLLLQNMQQHTDRSAEFHCVLALVQHADDPVPLIAHGCWSGQISQQQLGEGGFGYDPIFWLPELGKTSAQLAKADKAALSHRGQALRLLLTQLRG
jgi:XTP/dITP diphosphohydrolase